MMALVKKYGKKNTGHRGIRAITFSLRRVTIVGKIGKIIIDRIYDIVHEFPFLDSLY